MRLHVTNPLALSVYFVALAFLALFTVATGWSRVAVDQSEATVQRLQEAADLLAQRRDDEALRVLDDIGGEPIAIRDPVSNSQSVRFSTPSLVFQTTRLLLARADSGRAGETEAVLRYIQYCRRLADQVRRTPNPTQLAENVARRVEAMADRVERHLRA